MNDYYVVAYKDGKYHATISGMGRNKNKLDSSHSKRTAQKYARNLRKDEKWAGFTFKVENNIKES